MYLQYRSKDLNDKHGGKFIMERFQHTTLKSIVTGDFRAAAVFEKYSLDFCCGGGITVDQACSKKNIDPALVYAELTELANKSNGSTPHFSAWPPDELVEYIVNVHHRYVREAIPILSAHTQKVAAVHGDRHPEVIAVARHFETVALDMKAHMMKEEYVLFPYIKQIVKARRGGAAFQLPPFGSQSHSDDGGRTSGCGRRACRGPILDQQLRSAG